MPQIPGAAEAARRIAEREPQILAYATRSARSAWTPRGRRPRNRITVRPVARCMACRSR
jgi:hypothetical protein